MRGAGARPRPRALVWIGRAVSLVEETFRLQSSVRSPTDASYDGNRIAVKKVRALLIAGFGGLLLLMSFSGVDAVRVLRSIQSQNDRIRADFIARNRLLNQIRSDLYLSGTYVRDYLLEPDPNNAD